MDWKSPNFDKGILIFFIIQSRIYRTILKRYTNTPRYFGDPKYRYIGTVNIKIYGILFEILFKELERLNENCQLN